MEYATALYCYLILTLCWESNSCQSSAVHSDKRYRISKISVTHQLDQFFANGFTCNTFSECSLKCLFDECGTWSYDDVNQICYMFPTYQEYHFKLYDVLTDVSYIWSTIYYGKKFIFFVSTHVEKKKFLLHDFHNSIDKIYMRLNEYVEL